GAHRPDQGVGVTGQRMDRRLVPAGAQAVGELLDRHVVVAGTFGRYPDEDRDVHAFATRRASDVPVRTANSRSARSTPPRRLRSVRSRGLRGDRGRAARLRHDARSPGVPCRRGASMSWSWLRLLSLPALVSGASSPRSRVTAPSIGTSGWRIVRTASLSAISTATATRTRSLVACIGMTALDAS